MMHFFIVASSALVAGAVLYGLSRALLTELRVAEDRDEWR